MKNVDVQKVHPDYCHWALEQKKPYGGLAKFVAYLKSQPEYGEDGRLHFGDEDRLNFGTYKDKTYGEVKREHPDYCRWALAQSNPWGGLARFVDYLMEKPKFPQSSGTPKQEEGK